MANGPDHRLQLEAWPAGEPDSLGRSVARMMICPAGCEAARAWQFGPARGLAAKGPPDRPSPTLSEPRWAHIDRDVQDWYRNQSMRSPEEEMGWRNGLIPPRGNPQKPQDESGASAFL